MCLASYGPQIRMAIRAQQIKLMYYEADSGEVATKKSIIGALRLYLDFLNMFIFLMHILGVPVALDIRKRDDRERFASGTVVCRI